MVDTQTALKQEELPSNQADFIGVFAAPNGVGNRLLPGEERLVEKTSPFVGPPLASISGEQTTEETVEVEGELTISARDARLPVTCRSESSPAGGQIVSYFDRAETLLLLTASDAEELNIGLRYTGKPLDAALASARFLDAPNRRSIGRDRYPVVAIRPLGRAIADRVIVARIPDEHVCRCVESRRRIQRASGDRNPVARGRLPEQA